MFKKLFLFFFLSSISSVAFAERIYPSESDMLNCPDNEIFGGEICIPYYDTDENGDTIVVCPDPCAGDPKFELIGKSDENCKSHRPNCEDGIANYQCINGKVQCVKLSEPKCPDCIDSGHYEDIKYNVSCGVTTFAKDDPNGTECTYGKGTWKCINSEAVCDVPQPKCPACLGVDGYEKIGKSCIAINKECDQENTGTYECINNKVVCNVTQPVCLTPCGELPFSAVGTLTGKENKKRFIKDDGDLKNNITIGYACVATGATYASTNVLDAGMFAMSYKAGNLYNSNYDKWILSAITGSNAPSNWDKTSLGVKLYQDNKTAANEAYNKKTACYVCGSIRINGCFAPETKLSLADGSVKQAKDVATGDVLFNPVTRKGVTVEKVVEGPEDVEMILIEYASGSLKVSQEHPVLTKNGLVQAKDLKAGDTIYNGDNTEIEVTSVKTLSVEEGQYVINFVVKSDGDIKDYKNRMLLSEGIVTGDLTTQIELKLGK